MLAAVNLLLQGNITRVKHFITFYNNAFFYIIFIANMLIDVLAIGLTHIPAHRYNHNFLDFYWDYVNQNKQYGNRHLERSYNEFKKFIQTTFFSSQDVTEDLSANFQK
jgi:hypothetical protein